MSDIPRWADICEQERTTGLDAAGACHPLQSAPASPIDNFYAYLASLIPLGTEEELRKNDALGKTLLLGVVSGTEHYFRAVLAGLIHRCPLARKHSAAQPLSFGALDYYARKDLGLALLENISLATAGEVRSQTKRLVGIDFTQDESVKSAFGEYEKLCQFRHAAVHARGDLGHQNLYDLGIKNSAGRLCIKIDLPVFHSAASVAQNVVRGYNRLLYRKTLERWIGNKLLTANWSDDRDLFSGLFRLFYSHNDHRGFSNAYQAHRALLKILKKVLTEPAGAS